VVNVCCPDRNLFGMILAMTCSRTREDVERQALLAAYACSATKSIVPVGLGGTP
jgi:hypothetical protein